jgi:hypothetical protein
MRSRMGSGCSPSMVTRGDSGAVFQEACELLKDLVPSVGGDRLMRFDVDVREARQVERANDELLSHLERFDV